MFPNVHNVGEGSIPNKSENNGQRRKMLRLESLFKNMVDVGERLLKRWALETVNS
jgi:hypothetical protein